jgi:hypothetical protein
LVEALTQPLSATGRVMPADADAPPDYSCGTLSSADKFIVLTAKEKTKVWLLLLF